MTQTPYTVGYKWDTTQGQSELVAITEDPEKGTLYHVQDASKKFTYHYTLVQFERNLLRDAANLVSKAKQLEAEAKRADEDARAKANYEADYGYCDSLGLNDLLRGRTLQTLNRPYFDSGLSRKDFIKAKILEGATIHTRWTGKVAFGFSDDELNGWVTTEANLTQTGMAYAKYLCELHLEGKLSDA